MAQKRDDLAVFDAFFRLSKKKGFESVWAKAETHPVVRDAPARFFPTLCPAWAGHIADASAMRPYPWR